MIPIMNRNDFFKKFYDDFMKELHNSSLSNEIKDNDFEKTRSIILNNIIGTFDLNSYLSSNFSEEDYDYLHEKINELYKIVDKYIEFYSLINRFNDDKEKTFEEFFSSDTNYFDYYFDLGKQIENDISIFSSYYNDDYLFSTFNMFVGKLNDFSCTFISEFVKSPNFKDLVNKFRFNHKFPLGSLNGIDNSNIDISEEEYAILCSLVSDLGFYHSYTNISNSLVNSPYFYKNLELFDDKQLYKMINNVEEHLIPMIDNMVEFGYKDKLINIFKNIDYSNNYYCMALYDNPKYRLYIKECGLDSLLTYLENYKYYSGIGTLEQINKCFKNGTVTDEYYNNYAFALFCTRSNFPSGISSDVYYNSLLKFYKSINNVKMLNILKFYNEKMLVIEKPSSLDEILDCFDENGICNSKFYYNIVLKNKGIDINDVDIKSIHITCKDNPSLIKYMEFINKYCRGENILSGLLNDISELNDYFNENGPTKKLFDRYITNVVSFYGDNNYLLSIINNFNLNEIYKDDPAVLKFIKLKGSNNRYISFTTLDEIRLFYGECENISDELRKFYHDNFYGILKSVSEFIHSYNSLNQDIPKETLEVYKNFITSSFFRELPENERNDRFEYLADNISGSFIFGLSDINTNSKKFVSASYEDLDLFFNLLKSSGTKDKLTEDDVSYHSIVLSLCRMRFKLLNKDIVRTFPNMNSLLVDMSLDEIKFYTSGIITSENAKKLDDYVTEIMSEIKVSREKINDAIIECKNLNETKLREICRNYLIKKEDVFTSLNREDILKRLGMAQSYDLVDGKKKINDLFRFTLDYYRFMDSLNELLEGVNLDELSDNFFVEQVKLTKKEIELLLNINYFDFQLMENAFKNRTKPDEKVKYQYSLFKKVINRYIEYKLTTLKPNNDIEFCDFDIKTVGHVFELSNLNVDEIIKNFDLDIFIETIAHNEVVYNGLLNIFKSYYIGRLSPKLTDNSLDVLGVDLSCGANNIGLFINKYYHFLNNELNIAKVNNPNIRLQDISFNFQNVLNYIFTANAGNEEIIRLFGSVEYSDFIANPGSNRADYISTVREEKLADLSNFLYSLGSITIPSKDTIISNNDDSKKINIIVGNRTNSSNICFGERTDACMRVGGVGEGLFLKCLTDPNWFHIRLEEPETHQFISRVSGFRNGNTVYLNQLRDSIDKEKYSNTDLQEFIINFARSLIEETKDSEYPISNVFINDSYAFSSSSKKYKEYKFGDVIQSDYNLDDIKDYRLYLNNDIWTDVRTSAILIATDLDKVDESLEYVPVVHGPKNSVSYSCVSDKIYGINDYSPSLEIEKHRYVKESKKMLYEKINRVHAMKEKLLGKDYKYEIEDIDTVYESLDHEDQDKEYIVEGYASSDWYIFVDNRNNIYFDCITKIKQDDKELDYYNKDEAINNLFKYYNLLANKYHIANIEEMDINRIRL